MGMYTGLRVEGVVNEDYRNIIKSINNHDKEWKDHFVGDFPSCWRASFIPNGVLSYMPDEWDNDEFDNNFNSRTGKWIFKCSLKNYENEIEKFMNDIVPIIFKSIQHFEYYYEEWSWSKLYNFENGKLVYSGRGFQYEPEDDVEVWGV